MLPNQNGIFFALFSMLTLGVSSFLYKRSTVAIGPTNTTFFYYFFSCLIAFFAWLFFRESQSFERSALVWPALLASFLFSSVWAFNFAVTSLDVSIAATIRSLSFLVTIILAVVFTQETVTTKDWVAVGLAIAAIVLFGLKSE